MRGKRSARLYEESERLHREAVEADRAERIATLQVRLAKISERLEKLHVDATVGAGKHCDEFEQWLSTVER